MKNNKVEVSKVVDFLRDDGDPEDVAPLFSRGSLKLFLQPPGKGEQRDIAEKYIGAVYDGEIDPLMLDANLKAAEEIINLIRKDEGFKKLVKDEARKYPIRQSCFDAFGAHIQIRNTSKYDYKSCDDPVWNDLKAQEAELKQKIKDREALLRAIMSAEGTSIINEKTGELIDPPKCEKSTTLAYKFK